MVMAVVVMVVVVVFAAFAAAVVAVGASGGQQLQPEGRQHQSEPTASTDRRCVSQMVRATHQACAKDT